MSMTWKRSECYSISQEQSLHPEMENFNVKDVENLNVKDVENLNVKDVGNLNVKDVEKK